MIVANSLRVEGAGFGGDTNVVTLVTGSEEISLGKLVEGAGFGGDTNVVTLVTGSEEISLGKLSKEETAGKILDRIMKLRETK